MLAEILQVQQLQRDAGASQLGMDPAGIRQWARRTAGDLRSVEALFQRVILQVGQRVPRQPDRGGAADDRGHGAGTDAEAPRRVAVAPTQGPFQS